MPEIFSSRMRCPTCRAEQEWSDACRRCQSDLRLLQQTVFTGQKQRQRVLVQLKAGRFPEALRSAQELMLLDRCPANRRLLAVCQLLANDPERAAQTAAGLDDSGMEDSASY